MNSKFTLSTLYPREYIYTFVDDTLTPFSVIFKALNKEDIDFIKNLDNASENEVRIVMLERSLVRYINMRDKFTKELITEPMLDLLSLEQQNIIQDLIVTVSFVTQDFLENMKLNAKLAMETKFNTDTWGCDECKRRGLDKLRNCKFSETYDEDYDFTFKVLVGTEEFTDCPMYYRDNEMTRDMFDCYLGFEKGILPTGGGLMGQTMFYQYAVDLISSEVKKAEAKA